MSAHHGDRVRVTAGEHAGREGTVEHLRNNGSIALVRLPSNKLGPAKTWPFPELVEVHVEDLQRITEAA